MITIRKADERGAADFGWLQSRHTFSFGRYIDREHMGFETLRVINEDHVAPAGGFATHPHDNMEIISYVLAGALEHKDSMGNGSVIYPGEVQRMSAGTGVTHSEYNHSDTEKAHFLQIWFLPEMQDIEPGYEQKAFADDEKRGAFRLVASKEGRDGSVSLNQDVNMLAALIDGDEVVSYEPATGRAQWVQVARGSVRLNGQALQAGDGAAIKGEPKLQFEQGKDAEILLFDMKPLPA